MNSAERLEHIKRLFLDPSQKTIKQITRAKRYLLRTRNMEPARSDWRDTDDSKDYDPTEGGKKRQAISDDKVERAAKRFKVYGVGQTILKLEESAMRGGIPEEKWARTAFVSSPPLLLRDPGHKNSETDNMGVVVVDKQLSDQEQASLVEKTEADESKYMGGNSENNPQDGPKDNGGEEPSKENGGQSPNRPKPKEDERSDGKPNDQETKRTPEEQDNNPKERAGKPDIPEEAGQRELESKLTENRRLNEKGEEHGTETTPDDTKKPSITVEGDPGDDMKQLQQSEALDHQQPDPDSRISKGDTPKDVEMDDLSNTMNAQVTDASILLASSMKIEQAPRPPTQNAENAPPVGSDHIPRPSESCSWCSDFAYGLVGFDARQPGQMCASCAEKRICIKTCPGHRTAPLDGLNPESFNFRTAYDSLVPRSGQRIERNPWCSLCPTPAFFQCATQLAGTGNAKPAETPSFVGCGLLLCETCNILVRPFRDLARVVAVNQLEDAEDGSRADVSYLLPGRNDNE